MDKIRISEQRKRRYARNPALQCAKEKAWYAKRCAREPERQSRLRKNTWFKFQYGITLDDYESRRSAQDERCLICGKENSHLVLDHDHSTGKIRGFLCHKCNFNLAHYENEDLRRPHLEYLKRFKEN